MKQVVILFVGKSKDLKIKNELVKTGNQTSSK